MKTLSKLIIALLCCTVAVATAHAAKKDKKKDKEQEMSYNMQRALEAIENDDTEKCIEFLDKELAENPENGRAYAMKCVVYHETEELGNSLEAAVEALRYLKSDDKELVASMWGARGVLHKELGDTAKALEYLAQAIKMSPKDKVEDYLKERAQIYYEQDRYDLADADYRAMIKADPESVVGYMGLSRNCYETKQYDLAEEYAGKAMELADGDYGQAYEFRAKPYVKLGRYDLASKDFLEAIDKNGDFDLMKQITSSTGGLFTQLEKDMLAKAKAEPDNPKWTFMLGELYMNNYMQTKALEQYRKLIDKEPSSGIYNAMARCESHRGNYAAAIEYARLACQMDTTDDSSLPRQARYLVAGGQYDQAVEVYNTYLENNPGDPGILHRRAIIFRRQGNVERALQDLNLSWDLIVEDNDYLLLTRALCYRQLGQEDLAVADFKRLIEVDSTLESDALSPQAYFYMGDKEKAIEVTNRILEKAYKEKDADDVEQAGDITDAEYNAACLYAIMGDSDKAMEYLRKSLSHGSSDLNNLFVDTDFESLHELPAFKALVEEVRN